MNLEIQNFPGEHAPGPIACAFGARIRNAIKILPPPQSLDPGYANGHE
jgi:hypothetical protein